ncbi:hypothetical protein HZS_6780 [Henneguya salminicola]|nr:hypothetical protein HZS_6780 [Henneguya salminicola]
MYCAILWDLAVLTKYSWMPESIPAEFEIAGLFHFRQEILRKLEKIYTDGQDCLWLYGMLSLLSKVKTEDIGNALNFIKEKIQKNINFEPFQTYFNKTWVPKFPPNLWNTSEKEEEFDFIVKTINALEGYNRRLGECFSTSHPNIIAFVNTIKNEFVYYSSEMNERRKCGKGINW